MLFNVLVLLDEQIRKARLLPELMGPCLQLVLKMPILCLELLNEH